MLFVYAIFPVLIFVGRMQESKEDPAVMGSGGWCSQQLPLLACYLAWQKMRERYLARIF